MNDVIQKTDIDTQQLLEVSDMILKHAKKLGADEAEVDLGASKGFTVAARDADVETIEYHQDKVIDVTVYFGKRCGSASLTDIREAAVHDAVAAACHIAKFTGEDPASGLADKEDLAFGYPDLPMTYPWDISVNDATKMAVDCEREALAYDKRIMSAESTEVASVQAFNIYANSLGFTGSYSYTRHEISCVLVGKENEDMQRDFSYTVALDPKKLESISTVAREAGERTVKRLGARKLKTQKAPVIFAAEEARGLLGHFNSAIQGSRLYRKATFLVDHLGKKIFPDFVHIQEQPHLLGGMGTVAFDSNGVTTRPNVFVENGILTSYALGVYSARMLKMKTTGNAGGTHNLTIKTGDKTLPELLKSMGTGLLVTELMGQGVNILTGDYSRGVGGFWVENGEIQFPVHEVTIAGKLQDIFAGIAEVGNDVDTRGNIRTGSILINEMMIAGD